MKARTITVQIIADTRPFRRELLRLQLRMERSRRRRVWLRFLLWRLAREPDPRKEGAAG